MIQAGPSTQCTQIICTRRDAAASQPPPPPPTNGSHSAAVTDPTFGTCAPPQGSSLRSQSATEGLGSAGDDVSSIAKRPATTDNTCTKGSGDKDLPAHWCALPLVHLTSTAPSPFHLCESSVRLTVTPRAVPLRAAFAHFCDPDQF